MSDSGNGTPAGWYPDGQGGQRWWDGAQWGPVGQPPATPPPTTPFPVSQPPSTPAYGTSAPTPSWGAPAQGQQPGQYGAPDYAAPAYGAPGGAYPGGPGGPQSTSSKTRLFVIIAVAAVAVIAFAVTAFAAPGFLVGDDNGSGGASKSASGSDPAATVEAFVEASKNQDCDAVKDLVTEKLRTQIEDQGCGDASDAEALGVDIDSITYDVGDAEVDGDKATVPVTISAEELADFGDLSIDYLLVKQDGDWLIDDFQTDLGSLDDLPTDVPSIDIPSLDPSDLPTDLPTDLLSDFPTDFPSDFPSDFLSDFPSDFPTDFLSDFPTDFPTE